MRRGVTTLLVVSLVLALGVVAGRANAAGAAWSYDHLMGRIDGMTVHVGTVPYKLDRTMVVCNGVGRVLVSGGVRRWRRFACTQSVFRKGMLLDISFGVLPVSAARCRIVSVRYGP